MASPWSSTRKIVPIRFGRMMLDDPEDRWLEQYILPEEWVGKEAYPTVNTRMLIMIFAYGGSSSVVVRRYHGYGTG